MRHAAHLTSKQIFGGLHGVADADGIVDLPLPHSTLELGSLNIRAPEGTDLPQGMQALIMMGQPMDIVRDGGYPSHSYSLPIAGRRPPAGSVVRIVGAPPGTPLALLGHRLAPPPRLINVVLVSAWMLYIAIYAAAVNTATLADLARPGNNVCSRDWAWPTGDSYYMGVIPLVVMFIAMLNTGPIARAMLIYAIASMAAWAIVWARYCVID
jgi:hypothetical protein